MFKVKPNMRSFFQKVMRTFLVNISKCTNLKAVYQPSEKIPFLSLDPSWAWNYLYAFKYTGKTKLVLDAGCGVGYGTEELARKNLYVVGIDLSSKILYRAKRRRRSNLSFIRADCQDLPFRSQAFDLLTSFEVIEHVDNQHSFLKDARRVLNQNGVLILSTPVRQDFDMPVTPRHQREFTPKELEALLGEYFTEVKIEAKKIVDEVWMQRHGSFIGRNLRKLRKSYFGNIIAGFYDLYLNPVHIELQSIYASDNFENTPTIMARAYGFRRVV